jgi:hypothetical protein
VSNNTATGNAIQSTVNSESLSNPVTVAQGGTGATTAAAAFNALGGPARMLAAAQSGGMTGLGYVAALSSYASGVLMQASGTRWASGSVWGELLFADPSMTPNGYVTIAPWAGNAALAGTYVALYNSSGVQLGITGDLSGVASNIRGIREQVVGWSAVPADGKIYVLYTNATGASNAGPYLLDGQVQNFGLPEASLASNVIVMGFDAAGPTTMPASLSFGSNGIPSGFVAAAPAFFQVFLD